MVLLRCRIQTSVRSFISKNYVCFHVESGRECWEITTITYEATRCPTLVLLGDSVPTMKRRTPFGNVALRCILPRLPTTQDKPPVLATTIFWHNLKRSLAFHRFMRRDAYQCTATMMREHFRRLILDKS